MSLTSLFYDNGLLDPTNKMTPVVSGHKNTLYTASGGMIEVYEIRGAIRRFSGQEREDKIERLENSLSTWNKKRGVYVSFIHEHDPEKVKPHLAEHHLPMRKTMNRFGMSDGNFLLDSREALLGDSLKHDCLYLVVHTTVGVVDVSKRKKEAQRWGFPGSGQGGNIYTEVEDVHKAVVGNFVSIFNDLSILYEPMDARASAGLIATMWTRHQTSGDQFSMLGDNISALVDPLTYRKQKDGSYLPILRTGEATLPRLGQQIFTDKTYYPVDRDDSFILRDHHQATLRLTRSPSGKGFAPYNELRSNIPRSTPYRMHLQMQSGEGKSSVLGFKRIISMFMSLTQPANLDIAKSIESLQALEDAGYDHLTFRMNITTWAKKPKNLERHVDQLSTAFSNWGNAGLTRIVDAPDIAAADSLPGGIIKGPACFMPVAMLSELLPLEISCSPWRQGLLMRSGENQPYPIDPGDESLINFHVYVLLGGTGKGKSVTMTDILKACMFRPGQDELPDIRYLDVGYTSKALFNYLRYMLPDDKRDQIVHYVMQNTQEYAVNAWDTPLGMRSQLPAEMDFLTDLVSDAIAGGEKLDGALVKLLQSLAIEIVTEGYRMMADKGDLRKTYFDVSDRHPTLVETIKRLNISAEPSETSWWSIVDALFEHEEIKMAEVAQRYAVPCFADIPQILSSSTSIKENYSGQAPGNTNVLDYARTVLMTLVSNYKVLSCETRLDYQAARIVGIDMQDVANSPGPTNLFYALLQNVLSRGFMTDPEEIAKLTNMPEQYREYQRKRVKALRARNKIFAFDELHRLSAGLPKGAEPPPAMKRLMRWIKEVRKYDIKLMLSSQSVTHMPPEIKEDEMWSLLFNMGVGGTQQELMTELFGISEYGQKVMRHELNGPEAGVGAACLFMANTNKGKLEQKIYVSTSPMELWAAPSNNANLTIMQEVLEQVGDPIVAARAMATLFPTGSAKKDKDRLLREKDITELQASALLVERAVARARDLQSEALVA